jgi:hypothetical protein
MDSGSGERSGHGPVCYRIVVRGEVTERFAEVLEGVITRRPWGCASARSRSSSARCSIRHCAEPKQARSDHEQHRDPPISGGATGVGCPFERDRSSRKPLPNGRRIGEQSTWIVG